jgi:hypothetical protein
LTNFYYFTTASGSDPEYKNLRYGPSFWIDTINTPTTSAGNTGVDYPSLIRILGNIGTSSKMFTIPSRNGIPFFKSTGNNEVDCFYPTGLATNTANPIN